MKTIPFSDRLNPVFVKEIRQSFHDKSIAISAILLTAGQLFLWFLHSIGWTEIGNKKDLSGVGLGGTLLTVLLLLVHFALRSGKERLQEGFDPALGTGYPPWKIVLGKTAAAWSIAGLYLLLFLPGIYILGGVGPDRELLLILPAFFLCGQLCQTISLSKKVGSFSGVLILLVLLWTGGYGFNTLHAAGYIQGQWSELLLLSLGIILMGATLMCGQIACYLPPRADRSLPFKTAVLVTMLYFLSCCWAGTLQNILTYSLIPGWTAGIFLIGALFERREPSRRQIQDAPRNIVLRFLVFFVTSGAVPALFTGAILMAIALLTSATAAANLFSVFVILFYFLLALYLAELTRQPAALLWAGILLVLHLPIIFGSIFPWGTALSLAAPEFLEPQTARLIAIAACIVGFVLNWQLISRFLRLYFGRKAEDNKTADTVYDQKN